MAVKIADREEKGEERFIAIADEILAEPIPALVRNPIDLPNDNGDSGLIRAIKEILSSTSHKARTPHAFALPTASDIPKSQLT